MRDVLPVLSEWYAAHEPFGLATVVAVSRSAPRVPGAAMAVGPEFDDRMQQLYTSIRAEDVFKTVAKTSRGLYLPLEEAAMLIPLVRNAASSICGQRTI